MSFDGFHKKTDQLYRVNAQLGTGTAKQVWDGVQAPIATFALREVPGVQNAVRLVMNFSYGFFKYGEKTLELGDNGMFYVDPSFFNVFDFKLLKGSADRPFPTEESIIVTETTAKHFLEMLIRSAR